MSAEQTRPELPQDPEAEWVNNYFDSWKGIISAHYEYQNQDDERLNQKHYPFEILHPRDNKDVLHIELTTGISMEPIEGRPIQVETYQLRIYKIKTQMSDEGEMSVGINILANSNIMLTSSISNTRLPQDVFLQEPTIYDARITNPDVLKIMQETKRKIEEATRYRKEQKENEAKTSPIAENDDVEDPLAGFNNATEFIRSLDKPPFTPEDARTIMRADQEAAAQETNEQRQRDIAEAGGLTIWSNFLDARFPQG